MKLIDDKSIDLILCDLPFQITAAKWDQIIPLEALWNQYKRIIKDKGAIVLNGVQPFTSALIMSNPKWFKYSLVWNKINHSNPFVAAYRPLPVHEDILVFAKGKTTYNPQKYWNGRLGKKSKSGKRLSELFNHEPGEMKNYDGYANPNTIINCVKDSQRGKQSIDGLHPTAKPVKLLEWLIKTYSNEGETVLDNASGSASCAIAAINCNRNYIMIEKDEKYFNSGNERIQQHLKTKL